MKKTTDNPNPFKTLRERAEEMLKTSHADIAGMSNEDVRKLVHELQVHQMELVIQNENLREAQIELSLSRDRYSDLYEFAPVGYLTLDRQGLISEANLTAATMLGVERNRLANRKLTDFLSDDAKDAWHLYRREVFSDEAKKSCELAMKPSHGNPHVAEVARVWPGEPISGEIGYGKDPTDRGNPLTVRLESLAFRDEDGNLSQCRTALIDVTTVRQARQQLEQSEQRYHRLTDAVTDYVYHVRVEHGVAVETIHGANCEGVTGYTPQEFRANPMLWITMVPPEDRPAVERQAACVLSGRNRDAIEHRIQHKDGQIRWVLNTVSPQHDEQGHLVAYDGLVRDITKRKEAEAALHQLTETLEQRVAQQTQEVQLLAEAVSHLAEGVVITDDELDWPGPRIRFVNDAMCRITGYTADELVGQTPRVLQGEQTDRGTRERMKSELAAGRPFLCELVNYRKDGTTYDAEMFITPLFDSEGRRTNFVSVHRDVTERHKLQREVLSIAEDEQRRIGQDLHDSAQQELAGLGMLAQTLLENLSKQSGSRSRQTLAESDQADSPNSGEFGYVSGEFGYYARELATRILNGLTRTHQEVQAIARGLVPVRIDTQGLMDALRELALRTDDLAGVTCAFKCEQPVEVDDSLTATHLYRITQEAVTNALKHGPPEHILIALESENGYPILQVADDGTGFDATEQTEGMGLKTMRYRASLIGASLTLSPVETGGTLVICKVFGGGVKCND